MVCSGWSLAGLALTAAVSLACSRGGEQAGGAVVGGDAGRGEALIAEYGCGSCHVVPGVRGARGKVGPPLTDFGERHYIAGAVPNTPENLIRWIQNPQAIEPGTVMPTLGVSREDARDIAAYLHTLGDALGPPHPLPARALRAF